MTYFIIAGEASGDMHAAALMHSLRQRDPQARFTGMGGPLMRQAGCTLVQDYDKMAFMGFVAVLKNLPAIRRNFAIAKAALLSAQPDALILIDYPTFNLKMARFCRKHLPDTRIYYYIPPKVWAWKSWRVHRIARYSDKILGIFPFEPAFYARYGYTAGYVGNPTMDAILSWKHTHTPASAALPDRQPLIAILPGSRKHEIEKCLPKMLTAARHIRATMPHLHIAVSGAPAVPAEFYHKYLQGETLLFSQTYQMLSSAQVAIVNSGTATLEAALLSCPQVAVYHIAFGRAAALIKDFVFQIKHFTLVNIIAGKEVIKEKIAYLFTVDEVERETRRLLTDTPYRQQMLDNYQTIADILGDTPASDNAADCIIAHLQQYQTVR